MSLILAGYCHHHDCNACRQSSIFRIMSGLHFCLVHSCISLLLTIIYHNNILSQHSSKRENLLKLLRNSVCSPIAAKHNNLCILFALSIWMRQIAPNGSGNLLHEGSCRRLQWTLSQKKKNQGYSTIVFESNWTSISHMHLDDTRILEQMQTALSLCCFGHNASRVQQGSALGPTPFGNEWVRV